MGKINNEKYIKRKSPPFHAKDYPNQIKKGNDNLNYISMKDKNNIYKWIKYIDIELPSPNKYKNKTYIGDDLKYYYSKENKDKIYYWEELKIKIMNSPNKYYKQFPNYKKPDYDLTFFTSKIKDLTKDLKKIGILFFYLKWGKESLYAGHTSFIKNKIKKYLEENNNYPNGYIFTSDSLLYSYSYKSKNDGIYIHHAIRDNVKNSLNQILISYFPKRTFGLQNNEDAIIININETNNLLPTKKHIMFVVEIVYLDKVEISNDDFNKVHKFVTKKIGKKYIYDLRDAYNSLGSIMLFYTVNTDTITKFAEKFKNMKIPFLPKLKLIRVATNDQNANKKLSWTYTF